jgi:hypothetical protein
VVVSAEYLPSFGSGARIGVEPIDEREREREKKKKKQEEKESAAA